METAHDVVLVVEDEEESRETLRELLELEGYQVQTAANGSDALDRLGSLMPCVVILDLFMPVMDGWQLLDQLRSDGRLPGMKIVIATSAPHRAPTGFPVFEKPIDLERLLRTIDAVC
jgi:CheY-like chemotaxis protein